MPPITDRYDGITVGTLCTERWIEKNAVLSILLGKAYVPALRSDLDSQDPGVKNLGVDDASNVYEITAPPFNKNGGVDVNIQDQTTRPIVSPFCRALEAPRAIASNTVPNTYEIELVDASGLLVGDTIGLFQDSTNPASFIADIISIAVNTITMDTPLDVIFDTALSPVLFKLGCDLNVVGSLAAPVVFEFANGSDIDIDLTRIIFTIVSTDPALYNEFGDIALLTNGVVLRKRNADGTYFNIANIKSNGQWKAIMYDVDFFDPTHPLAVNAVVGRLTFAGQNKIGVTIRIANTEALELVVQDDLSTLIAFIIVGEGHYVDEV